MSGGFRVEINKNLNSKETSELLEILDNVDDFLERGELDQALKECELAIQLDPNSAIAHNYRGEIYDDMGQLENAIINYQKALQLDPEYKDALENLLGIETEFEKMFQESTSKHHLDQALEYAYNDEWGKALQECEAARPDMPNVAVAYNYLGLILETIDQLQSAIDAYLRAVELNPRFYAARENLANARVKMEEEYYLIATESREGVWNFDDSALPYDETLIEEILEKDEPVPGWVYLNEKSFFLEGWPGHRIRPGRSGYDPLDRNAEEAHVEMIIARLLLNGKFRTRNKFYLLLMAFVGVLFCTPLIALFPLLTGVWRSVLFLIIYSPYWIAGIALLRNVFLSLQLEGPCDYDDNGYTFF